MVREHLHTWCQEGAAKERDIGQSHSLSALMHKEKIAYARIDQCFKWRERNALKDTCPNETIVVIAVYRGTPPCRTCNHEQCSQKKKMSLAPYSCRRDAQDATHCNTAQMIRGEQRCVLESYAENNREGDGVGSE